MADKKNTIYPRFNFCGDIVIPKKNGPWVKRDNYGKAEKISLNMGIKNGMNCVYVSAQGFKNDVIKTKDIDNKDMDVDWADRLDEDIIKSVSSMRKFVVNLGEHKEFITAWDMIEYLESALAGYAEPIVVKGVYNLRPYKEQFYQEFQIQNVYAAREDDKPHLTMNLDLYYDKNSVDKSSLKENGKIFMNCYTPMYSKADNTQKMFPITTVVDTKVLKNHPNWIEYKLQYMETKSRNPVHMNWAIGVVNGAEEVEFSEDTLTDAQKMQIELGMSKLEDFRPRGSIYGERTHELRLIKPLLMGEFKECMTAAESEFTAREFEDEIYTPAVDETVDDMVNSSSNKPAAKPIIKAAEPEEDDDSIDTLF